MYPNWPDSASALPRMNGNAIEIDLIQPSHKTPDRIQKVLTNFGWSPSQLDPNTQEQLYQKLDAGIGGDIDPDLTNGHWRWYEAVAYEFAKFVNVGLDA